ncbi:MAG: dephospho-CoA kinase [Candidatus Marinimicrobia bacterium]|nr:dephospho-CoA kinase [Candidatus Neomarinimicrobiota bacterium]
MLSIGVTGGLGSGKSAAMKIFYELGANILSADDIAKHILKVDRNIIEEIKNTFGADCYIDGELQADVLASRAFQNPENLKKLNDISHPALKLHLEKYIAAMQAIPGILMIEAAILLEAGYQDAFDKILLITADKNIRMERAVARQEISEDSIKERIALQMPEEEKRKYADFIIENNGNENELKEACKRFWEEITVCN